MKKSMYSLMLAEQVVEAIDRLAAGAKTLTAPSWSMKYLPIIFLL